ncbi:eukaryotic translation initiation factor eIF2A-domain-containing protein [Radiomyces spectabilis]|uniref:eukaryotic translation initiation factor eIF2A-domain-containing protein n=1 Tax=Radiomyces spectabilis TaxID=64574 RepID=UPI00221FA3BD|nr:eukaryotic translation initiation factor eIF2A-domain-containing protein [Radiomyces spectabilis]KAI8391263.1 eukaryotic translation initiation factor eIF2A-domain-containing protein [Radiomyces spectabilis]
MPGLDLKNLPEREEDIDFSDIYEKHTISVDNDFDSIVVVDGAPIVDEAKEEKLLTVLKKLFTKGAGEIKESGIWMPMSPNDKGKMESKGYLFIDFESVESAHAAVKNLDGHKMSKTHQLSVNKFTDVEKYTNMNSEFKEPEFEEFKPKEHLRSWLADEQARDQFVMYRGDDVSIFWNRKTENPEHVYSRTNWTETYVQWSPLGSYLATFHTQGIALWGGPSWSKIVRFVHPGVKLIDFSPNERFLVTWSNEPISPSKIPEGSPNPFSEYDEGNQIIIWDVMTGALLRSFPLVQGNNETQKTIRWPMFKWSASEKYFARIVPGQQLSVYEAATMGLVGKKSIKIEGIVDFEWSPAKPDQADAHQKEDVLAYWTPEVGNQPARVTMMTVPSKEIIRTKNLFNVTDCKLHWQSKGRFLAVKVDRHTKTKKSTFSNIEIFRVSEKAIPVETLEIKDPVLAFAWEPQGERFATITSNDPNYGAAPTQGVAPVTIKTQITFYYLDKSKAVAGFKPLKMLDKKTCNYIFWSPKGRHVVFATLRSSSVFDIEFYDVDFDPITTDKKEKEELGATVQLLSTQEHYGVTDIEWDPTGRFLVSGSSMWRHTADHGFCVWDFKGQLLFKQNIEKFKQLLWRPRPKSLLSPEQKKKIKKNLRQYSKVFEEEDLAAGDATAAKLIAARRKAVEEWYAWRKAAEARLAEERKSLGKELRTTDEGKSEIIEEWVEEVIEETEEIVE